MAVITIADAPWSRLGQGVAAAVVADRARAGRIAERRQAIGAGRDYGDRDTVTIVPQGVSILASGRRTIRISSAPAIAIAASSVQKAAGVIWS